MFTGLIEARGRVHGCRKVGKEMDLEVDLGSAEERDAVGASIALAGVCCTVVERSGSVASFRLSAETLARTWFGSVELGDELNVERALCVGDPLGGHIVQGHVDGVGEVTRAIDAHAGGELGIRIPASLTRYCVEKGSIAIDGVSLTIASIDGDRIVIAVIPHTAEVTTLGAMREGRRVHVEVDVLAKYVEKQVSGFGER